MVWKLTLEYDGTRYAGWQEQPAARTVAGDVRKAAAAFFQTAVELAGAGRTDAGVHALGQVARLQAARLQAAKPVRPRELLFALNDRLPADINVLGVEEVAANFHARHDALARYYVYQISRRRSAFAKKYVWWVKDQLDAEAMRQAAAAVLGRHDFAAFCERQSAEKSTVVVVERVELVEEGDLILLRLGASHFLWKMVRRLVGALVAVGRGNLAAADFEQLVNAPRQPGKPRFDVAANTAPPSGLFLERVAYRRQEPPGKLAAVTPLPRFKA